MLVLTRRKNEKIHIGDDITVTIAEIQKGRVKVGIDAPKDMAIVREELLGPEKRGKALIRAYKEKRADTEDPRLTNTICMAADIIIKLAAGFYSPEQTDSSAWEMIEALIRQYAEGRCNNG